MVKKGFKHFIEYEGGKKVETFMYNASKMNAYRRDFDETKCMSFLIRNDELLEKYNETSDKVRKVIKKRFTSELYTMINK